MRICVIHATAGAGHKKAAEAILHGLQSSGHDATIVDALDYTNPFFKVTYPAAYTFMVTKMSWAWGFFFYALDKKWLQPLVRVVRRIYNGLNAQRLQQYLIQSDFDAIITTQFLSAEVSAYLKRTKKIRSKVICVVTDFDVHRIWVNDGIDEYTGATQFTKDKLIALGVDSLRAHYTGIPTDKAFTQPVDKIQLKAKLGLDPNAFSVLVATGSFGMGPIEELVAMLEGCQLMVVCGHNKHLYERLRAHQKPLVHVYGMVDNMPELMSVADLMVTKPGGLSIAEALVKHLPMFFFSAIPGQETHNILVLKALGVAEDQIPLAEIAMRINQLKNSSADFHALKERMAAVARPEAVHDIIALATSP